MSALMRYIRANSTPVAGGCRRWLLKIDACGYAVIAEGGHWGYRVHRYGYMELHSVKLTSSQHVRHTCDNPWCVNPRHWLLGTHADNMRDMNVRGRQRGGTSHDVTQKLDEDKVRAIRADPRGNTAVARDYGVTPGTIMNVRRRRQWRWVT